jgi:hypothetical protein
MGHARHLLNEYQAAIRSYYSQGWSVFYSPMDDKIMLSKNGETKWMTESELSEIESSITKKQAKLKPIE